MPSRTRQMCALEHAKRLRGARGLRIQQVEPISSSRMLLALFLLPQWADGGHLVASTTTNYVSPHALVAWRPGRRRRDTGSGLPSPPGRLGP